MINLGLVQYSLKGRSTLFFCFLSISFLNPHFPFQAQRSMSVGPERSVPEFLKSAPQTSGILPELGAGPSLVLVLGDGLGGGMVSGGHSLGSSVALLGSRSLACPVDWCGLHLSQWSLPELWLEGTSRMLGVRARAEQWILGEQDPRSGTVQPASGLLTCSCDWYG